jgi:hypothetical protein
MIADQAAVCPDYKLPLPLGASLMQTNQFFSSISAPGQLKPQFTWHPGKVRSRLTTSCLLS